MATTLTASEQFRRLYQKKVRRERELAKELNRRAHTFFRKKHVVGFGVGSKHGQFAAIFYITRKVANARLAAKDRLPRSVRVGNKRIPTDVVAVGRTTECAGPPIGDSNENRKSYHVELAGDWKMGTQIRSFMPEPGGGGGSLLYTGTSGARVIRVDKKGKPTGEPPLVLSCAHVLFYNKCEVAQAEKDRDPQPRPPGKDHNYVGDVLEVADMSTADAGVFECSGALREIMHIGEPKEPVTPTVGLYVQKSGRTTGLTWGKIAGTNITKKLDKKEAYDGKDHTYTGMFQIENKCIQDPAGPGKLPPGENVPPNLFGWLGDSGSLIVAGKPNAPGEFGDPVQQKKYNDADDVEKGKIRQTYERAALGLFCLKDTTHISGQEIALALKALNIKLDVGP
jgi:hypothetical protein